MAAAIVHAAKRQPLRQMCDGRAMLRQRIRDRIREIDQRKAGRVLPLQNGGLLHSAHTASELHGLCKSASFIELEVGHGAGRCFVLQHPSVPDARLAELWLLEPLPVGRFDGGLHGSVGVGATLHGTAAHAALTLECAIPLVRHVVSEAQRAVQECSQMWRLLLRCPGCARGLPSVVREMPSRAQEI